MINRRIGAAVSAGFSNGRSNIGLELGRYTAYSATAQLQYTLARCCAMSLAYDYFNYNLTGVGVLQEGLPPQYDRNAYRVGFTLWFPVYGAFGSGSGDGRTRSTR